MYRDGVADLMLEPEDVDEEYIKKTKALLIFRHGACCQSLQGGCAESVDAGEEERYTCDI